MLACARVCVDRDIYTGGGFDAERDRDMFYRDKPGSGSRTHVTCDIFYGRSLRRKAVTARALAMYDMFCANYPNDC